MSEPERITAEEVYGKLKSGKALLVCAYEDEERFKKLRLEGAISFSAFKSKLPSLSKDQEIIFYCWLTPGSDRCQAGSEVHRPGLHECKMPRWRCGGLEKSRIPTRQPRVSNETENPLPRTLKRMEEPNSDVGICHCAGTEAISPSFTQYCHAPFRCSQIPG